MDGAVWAAFEEVGAGLKGGDACEGEDLLDALLVVALVGFAFIEDDRACVGFKGLPDAGFSGVADDGEADVTEKGHDEVL